MLGTVVLVYEFRPSQPWNFSNRTFFGIMFTKINVVPSAQHTALYPCKEQMWYSFDLSIWHSVYGIHNYRPPRQNLFHEDMLGGNCRNVPIDDTTKSDIHFASTGIYGNSWIIEDGINIGDGYNLLCYIGLISCLRSNLITEPKHPPQRLSTITSFVNIFHLLVVQVTFTCSDLQPSNQIMAAICSILSMIFDSSKWAISVFR